jgi:hypothetical protein
LRKPILHIVSNISSLLKKWLILNALLLMQLSVVRAQDLPDEEQVKAVFIFNFTKFIDWPASAFSAPESPFIIGVVGKQSISSYLQEAIAGEYAAGRTIMIKHYSSPKDIRNCHILYIGSEDPEKVKSILATTQNQNILTVGDSPNFLRWGGMVRFFTEKGKIRLEINSDAARSSGIRISSKLLSVASIY